MGIPSFYRWLVERYPNIVADAIEEAPVVVNGVPVPINLTAKNPNQTEYDNLYLDMNGIIHPCFHPEGLPGPKSYDQVFQSMFKYLDKIFSVVRPRSLLYMAIDGVAPRAKMNQQRARRFRAAKEAADEEDSRMERQSEGEDLAFSKNIVKMDSNVITPGTEFMSLLSSALRYYVHLRMNNEPGWRGIKVIISDASVPGEGEHKIMSYIRLQRNLSGYRPNTTHCLYGLDADLIMLALATHEIHFSVLREEVRKEYAKGKGFRDRNGSSSMNKESHQDMYVENMEDYITRQKFQFLHIWILRDYLRHDLRIPNATSKMDLERLIDDFVFMCIFVGNDFLPHVPSLEISEGAIDLLMSVYKKQFKQMGGYLTNSFEINFKHVEQFVQALGSHEGEIFRKRTQVQIERDIRFRSSSDNVSVCTDQVKLGEEGWKERFYAQKFEAKTADDREEIRRQAVQKYVEGICWVMQYYYQGVCSWQWFYPYHYAPFASDFCGLDKLEIQFTIGKPFKPFDQLMGVLPAARKLMLDSSSPILDLYPTEFELDMNGKRHSWQAICKLPFIEESRLLAEIAKVEHTLTEDEKRRNSLGMDVLLMHKANPLAVKIICICNSDKTRWPLDNVKQEINPEFSRGMNGYVYISTESMCPAEINPPVEDMATIVNNEVVSFFYEHPAFHPHIPRPPAGVHKSKKWVKENDAPPPPVLWHETSAVRARALSERIILKSISGARLARLSHELVRNHIHVKPSENQACVVAPLGENELTGGKENYITEVGKEGSVEHTVSGELNPSVSGKESVGSESIIVAEPKKRKRKRGKKGENSATHCDGIKADGGSDINVARIGEKKQDGDIGDHSASVGGNHIHVMPSESQVCAIAPLGENELNGGKENYITPVGGKEGIVEHAVLGELNPSVNGKGSVVSESIVVAEPKERKRKRGKKGENSATQCEGMKADGGSDINVAMIGEKKQDGDIGDHSAVGGSENHLVTESKRRKRRRKGKQSSENGVATDVGLVADKDSDSRNVTVKLL